MSECDRFKPPVQSIRRVVAGQAEDGSTVVASDTEVAPILPPLVPGSVFFDLWSADKMPILPDPGAEPDYGAWFPPRGGYRFEPITLPPDGTRQPPPAMDHEAALAENTALLPGLMDVMDPKHPGWHSTDTIDLTYIISGECVLKLKSGETVLLKTGDTLIQNGARHAWANPGNLPCALFTVSLGVKRT